MPHRMLKEGIRTSRQIGHLDDFSFRTWTYLLTYVDDFGRGSADPELLKGFLFSRRKGTTEKNIADALSKLACEGLICLYQVDGEPFLYFPTWSKHQRIQSKTSKFPEPPENEESTVSHGESRCFTVSHGDSPLEVEVEEEVETNKKPSIITRCARETEDDFAKFWSAYPNKQSKEAARKAWKKVNVSLDIILSAIAEQKKSAQWQNPKYIPYPATWLNGKRWEDTLPAAQPDYRNPPKGASGTLGEAELEAISRLLAEEVSSDDADIFCDGIV